MIVATAGGGPRAQTTRAVPSALYADLSWRCIGPFDGGPVASVEGVAGTPGMYTITTPSGGAWKTVDGGDSWTPIDRPAGSAPVPSDPHRWVDPANPRRIARTAAEGIEVSLDAGTTWTAFHRLPIAEVARLTPREHAAEPTAPARVVAGSHVNVSIADPVRAGLIFAGTDQGVFVSFDNGARWDPLRLNMPVVRINDLDIRGSDLVAATQGRSTWALAAMSLLRQVSAASASAAAMLFAPADAIAAPHDVGTDASTTGIALDYYLGAAANGPVALAVTDASGRVVHRATSDAPDATDRWLPVTRPLAATPGHHRVTWNLRVDPPPSPHHRFAQLARTLFESVPADPDGPRVLPGTYRVTLDAGGRTYSQPLVVGADPASTPELAAARRQEFDLAMKVYDAMVRAHQGFLQLERARDRITPLLASSDQDLAALAAYLDAGLAVLDGSDWTGLVIPDAEDESLDFEEDAKEGKHPDFVPPKPVSLSKDYDDPTSVLGRNFANVDHAPAFAILGTKLGETMARLDRDAGTPDALAVENYATRCEQLAGVLDEWRAINAGDLPRLNEELAKRRLPPVAIASNVPAITCPAR